MTRTDVFVARALAAALDPRRPTPNPVVPADIFIVPLRRDAFVVALDALWGVKTIDPSRWREARFTFTDAEIAYELKQLHRRDRNLGLFAKVETSYAIPRDEIHVRQDGKTVGKLTNVDVIKARRTAINAGYLAAYGAGPETIRRGRHPDLKFHRDAFALTMALVDNDLVCWYCRTTIPGPGMWHYPPCPFRHDPATGPLPVVRIAQGEFFESAPGVARPFGAGLTPRYPASPIWGVEARLPADEHPQLIDWFRNATPVLVELRLPRFDSYGCGKAQVVAYALTEVPGSKTLALDVTFRGVGPFQLKAG